MGRKQQKSGKAKWKKIDISDVDQALVDRRNEAISHGAPIREIADSSLFFVDKSASKGKAAAPKPKPTKAEIRARALRSEAGLLQNPKVKPMKVSVRKEAPKGVPSAAETKKVKRIASGISSRGPSSAGAAKAAPAAEGDGSYDLWDSPAPPPPVRPGIAVDFVEPALKKAVKAPRTLREPTKAQAAGVAAVAAAETGESYNPSFAGHQDALGVALAREVRRADVRERLREELALDVRRLPSERDFLRVDTDDDEGEEEAAQGEGEGEGEEAAAARRAAVEARKKTKAERNKDARKRAEAEARRREEEEKRKLRDLARLRDIEKEVEEKAARDGAPKPPPGIHARPPRLGKRLYEEPAPDFLLEEELPGSLRELKPAGSLVRDRFLSLQKRQVLEPRVPQKKRRRYQVKIVTKDRT